MKTRLLSLSLVTILIMLAVVGCGSDIPNVDWTLEVSGAVETPLALSYKDLANRDQVILENVLMRKSQGENETNSWEGPDLMAILDQAGVSSDAVTVVFMAADGYAKEVNLEDLDQAIIALKRDGLYTTDDPKAGPIRVVIPNLPADSWIFALNQVQVMN